MTNTPTQAAIEAAQRAANDAAAASDEYATFPMIEAAIEAYRAAMREAGVVEVPVEATRDMILAAETYDDPYCPDITWELMIAARPQIGGE